MTIEEPRLRHAFRDLPDIATPPTLDARILRTHRSRLRRNASILAGACLACASLALAPMLLQSPAPVRPAPPPVTAATTGANDVDLQIQAIDMALQSAYDSNARNEEIATLWMAREKLVAVGEQTPGSI